MRSTMRGTMPLSNCKQFTDLIKSVCPETQTLEFREYDRIYTPSPDAPRGALKNSIRLRCRLSSSQSQSATNPITIQYSGPMDRRVPNGMERRPVTSSKVVGGIREGEALLSLLGCTLTFEYVRRVIRHCTRNGLFVDIFLVERLGKQGDPSNCLPIDLGGGEQQCVVEVWKDDLSSYDILTSFVQYLSPYITLHSATGRRR